MMNKKEEAIYWILFPIMAGLFLLVFLTMAESSFHFRATFELCDYMNMNYKNMAMGEVCIDHNNDAHFVDIRCDGFLWNIECKATIISVGEVRVR